MNDKIFQQCNEIVRKKATDIDKSKFDSEVDLPTLKYNVYKLDTTKFQTISTDLTNWNSELDKLGADNLKTDPIDLKKLGNVVRNEVVKKNIV